jgi:hypothetical protein
VSHGKYIGKAKTKKYVLELEQIDSDNDGGGNGKYINLTTTNSSIFSSDII